MKRLTNALLIIMILGSFVVLAGCGTKNVPPPQEPTKVVAPANTPLDTEVQVPEWFGSPPDDPNYFYAAATYKGKDMGLAIDSAKDSGRNEIARQLGVKVTGMMKRFREEAGVDEDAEFLSMTTDVSKSIVSEVLNGSKAVKQKVYKESIGFRAYVLMELPLGQMNAALMEKLKENKNMYTRFRATQAFQELEGEVEKYEQFKKEQTQGTGNP